ncbi:SDR family oxidoreductase [Streptomyces sp. R21]|uniref:SDR family oxidoreductase n=1 Tax=Streptomyces sp. R21 TaxID=3238627 RepID=A0AB39P5N0_9ACTN
MTVDFTRPEQPTAGSPLDGRHTVVIGGSSGIGLAVAEAVIRRGGRVTIGSRNKEKLAAAEQELGDAARGLVVDIGDEESVRDFFAEAGPLDHLVCSAGDIAMGPVAQIDLAQARHSMDTKFFGQLLSVRHALPGLAADGSVVLMSGTAGWLTGPGLGVVAAANLAVHALGRVLVRELAPIRVNMVAPGVIDTPYWDPYDPAVRDQVFADASQSNPVGRVGQPEEVAHAVMCLLENAFANGVTLPVDGGLQLAG